MTPTGRGLRRLLLLLFTLLLVLVPFLFWRATWFGRRLDDREIDRYLAGDKLHQVQHALAQIAERIINREMTPAAAARWYPRVVAIADHRLTELRSTAAWLMGQDTSSEEFHRSLLQLLRDPEVLVRRNAALSLVRFKDPSGRPEVLGMLRSFAVRSPGTGRLSFDLRQDEPVNVAAPLARLDTRGNGIIEIRSPLPGRIEKILAVEGQTVAPGDQVILLAPSPGQVWEALRALVLIGRPEDLPQIELLAPEGEHDRTTDKIRQQAFLTAQAIRSRQ